MRRYMKLVFRILEYTEMNKANGNKLPLPEFEDYENSTVEYHVRLCAEAGYINIDRKGTMAISIVELTWAGHNEIDRMRKEGSCAISP